MTSKNKEFENVNIDTIKWAYRLFDIVTNAKGAVGFIQEVSVNDGVNY